MSHTCPSCSQPRLSAENPFGLVVCENCGWIGRQHDDPANRREIFKQLVNWLGASVLVFTLAFMSVQLARWKNYSSEASVLMLKILVGWDKDNALMEMGAICNTLEKFSCSVDYFFEAVDRNPNNSKALANLAMALAKLGKWSEAKPHFDAYFSLGGDGYDVMLWYGKTLAQLENPERGLDWYYYALTASPTYQEAADVLVEELTKLGRWDEALSVIGIVTSGQPENQKHWQEKLDGILQVLNAAQVPRMPSAVRLPSLNGVIPLVAVRLMEKGRLHYFALAGNSDLTVMDRGLLDENLISFPSNAELIDIRGLDSVRKGHKMRLSRFELGPWLFKDVDVVVCEKCPNTLGRGLLAELKVRSFNRNKTEFKVLALKNSSSSNLEEDIIESVPGHYQDLEGEELPLEE